MFLSTVSRNLLLQSDSSMRTVTRVGGSDDAFFLNIEFHVSITLIFIV